MKRRNRPVAVNGVNAGSRVVAVKADVSILGARAISERRIERVYGPCDFLDYPFTIILCYCLRRPSTFNDDRVQKETRFGLDYSQG